MSDLFTSAQKAAPTRSCPDCGSAISGHPNKKFCGQKCKDHYHNIRNPRGMFAHLKPMEDSPDLLEMIRRWEDRQGVESSEGIWDEEAGRYISEDEAFYYATTHPFSGEGLGQE